MEQSSIQVTDQNDTINHSLLDTNNIPTTASLSCSQENSNQVVISDDDVEIVTVIKMENKPGPSIKIESGDENEYSESKDEKVSINLEMCYEQNVAKGNASPKDQTCSICLSEYDNKSFLDQCFHAFCFYCILQWSEVVRTCPLCKAEFSQIIHSVSSMTKYKLHKLPSKSEGSAGDASNNRRFRYRTTVVDGRQGPRHTASGASNAWEQRAERRERLLAMRRRKTVRAKEKRQYIYARNLWVQNVAQIGRTKYRDTSPQFFHANPACTHRLVPWLTRELYCLLNDEKSHVDFVLQVIMSLITKVPIDSEEFVEQLEPFLSEKTEHFCHEFLSYARSPFDMKAYDDRAQYDSASRLNTDLADQTPIVIDTANTGWDSPDESASNSTPNLSEPGPSGISTETINNWSPPIAQSIEIPANSDVWSDVTEQSTNQQTRNDVIEISPDILEIPKRKHRHKHKHKHKHRHKHRHKSRDKDRNSSSEHSLDPDLARPSTSSTATDSQGDPIIVSSDHDSSPEVRVRSRSVSRDSSDYEDHRKLRHKGKRSKKDYSKSRDHNYSKLSSERVRRKHRKGFRESKPSITSSPNSCGPSSLATTSSEARPSSPTEEEMRREILELERKISVDTKRLEELLQKQKQRKKTEGVSGNNEESENEGLSR